MEMNHPIQYSIFKPNSLIQADRSELKGIEIKVYNEILNNNHSKTPEVLVYKIPYDLISYDPQKNGARDRKRIGQALQSRSIYLDEEFVKQHLGERSARSIVPFPEIVYNKDHLEIHLSPKFKRILTILNLGFTKGDIETLRRFKHDISHKFYWVARQKQTFHQVWKISLEDFRTALFISGYTDWRNFKRNIIDAIQEDMQGTWMDFTIDFVRKGRGGAVKEFVFKFKKGPKDEKDEPVGLGFEWEWRLQKMGISDQVIKQFRQYVKVGSSHELPNGKVITWSSEYILFSGEVGKVQFDATKNDPKKKPIENLAAWFVSGLLEGRWLDEVEEKIREKNRAMQSELF